MPGRRAAGWLSWESPGSGEDSCGFSLRAIVVGALWHKLHVESARRLAALGEPGLWCGQLRSRDRSVI